MGAMAFTAAVDATCTPDVLVHTWDLSRATGVDVTLDAEQIELLASGIDQIQLEVDEAMRSRGHYGPRIEVPANADTLTRVLAFMGRDATLIVGDGS